MNDRGSDEQTGASGDLWVLEEICSGFESQWSSDSVSLIAELAIQADPALQKRLVEELVSIDLEMRQSRSESINKEEYLRRLPGFTGPTRKTTRLARLGVFTLTGWKSKVILFPKYRRTRKWKPDALARAKRQLTLPSLTRRVTIFCFNRKPSHRVRGPRYLRGVGKKHSLVGLPIKSSFECAQKQTRHLLIIRSQTALDNEFKKCEGRPLRRRMG